MRYLLMIYEEPPATPPTDEEWAAMMPEYNAFGAWAAEKGWLLGGEALQDVAAATTVSVRDGRRIVTDGPFAETKEHLGGYYLIDAPLARRCHRGCRPDPRRPVRQGRGPPDHGDGLIAGSPVDSGEAVARVFREEHGRVVATLIRVLGDFDLAEEAVADAYVTALERWPADGVPANPGAWITTTARNRAIDRAATCAPVHREGSDTRARRGVRCCGAPGCAARRRGG